MEYNSSLPTEFIHCNNRIHIFKPSIYGDVIQCDYKNTFTNRVKYELRSRYGVRWRVTL